MIFQLLTHFLAAITPILYLILRNKHFLQISYSNKPLTRLAIHSSVLSYTNNSSQEVLKKKKNKKLKKKKEQK